MHRCNANKIKNQVLQQNQMQVVNEDEDEVSEQHVREREIWISRYACEEQNHSPVAVAVR